MGEALAVHRTWLPKGPAMGKKDKPPKDNPPKPKACRNCGRPLGEHTIHELAQCQAAQN